MCDPSEITLLQCFNGSVLYVLLSDESNSIKHDLECNDSTTQRVAFNAQKALKLMQMK